MEGGFWCGCTEAAQPQGPGSLGGEGGRPLPHTAVLGASIDGGGRGDLRSAQHLAVGCARPPVGSVRLQGNCFFGEAFRGGGARGAKRGLLCWLRHTRRLQRSLYVGDGELEPLLPPPPGLDREQALRPERGNFLNSFLPPSLPWDEDVPASGCALHVGRTEAACLATAGLAPLLWHVGLWVFWP